VDGYVIIFQKTQQHHHSTQPFDLPNERIAVFSSHACVLSLTPLKSAYRGNALERLVQPSNIIVWEGKVTLRNDLKEE